MNLEPSRPDADRRTLDGSNTVTLAPQVSRSTNRQVDPEVWFRIFHFAQVGHHGAPVAAYREETVEIALGPKEAFENGNIGALRRRMLSDKEVSAVLPNRRNPKPLPEPKTPRVVELLRKAIEWRCQLDAGEIRNQAEIARREGTTRARVTQVMGMLRLRGTRKRKPERGENG